MTNLPTFLMFKELGRAKNRRVVFPYAGHFALLSGFAKQNGRGPLPIRARGDEDCRESVKLRRLR